MLARDQETGTGREASVEAEMGAMIWMKEMGEVVEAGLWSGRVEAVEAGEGEEKEAARWGPHQRDCKER